jgi:tRNA pseudouridine(55) synthase
MRSGFLIIDKAPGVRSTQCVNMANAGTLDAGAFGVLVLLIGRATRTSRFVMMLPKTYLATARLGMRTDTDDLFGEVISTGNIGEVDEEGVDRALFSLYGHRDQIPPAFSAVKVKGKRAHSMARKGYDVRLAARPVLITSLRRTGPIMGGRDVPLMINCHQGTYVRSIVRDLGECLGCGATVLSLQRESLGPFFAADALSSDDMALMESTSLEERILPLSFLSNSFTSYRVSSGEEEALASGCPLRVGELTRSSWGRYRTGEYVMIFAKKIVSFARIESEGGACMARPVTNLTLEGP